MNKVELKPCPFCGGEVEIHPFANPEYYFAVDCKSCKVRISYISQNKFDRNRGAKENARINRQKTIEAWNARVEEEMKE